MGPLPVLLFMERQEARGDNGRGEMKTAWVHVRGSTGGSQRPSRCSPPPCFPLSSLLTLQDLQLQRQLHIQNDAAGAADVDACTGLPALGRTILVRSIPTHHMD